MNFQDTQSLAQLPVGFKLDTQFNGINDRGWYYVQSIFSPEHGGTIWMPVHFIYIRRKWTNDQIPVKDRFYGSGLALDVSPSD